MDIAAARESATLADVGAQTLDYVEPTLTPAPTEEVVVPLDVSTTPDPSSAHRPTAPRAARHLAIAAVAVLALIAAPGCGGDSKPAYCSDRSSLENDVKALPGLIKSGDLSGAKTQVSTIEADAKAVADSAKSDFPTETEAVTSSVTTLKSAISGLPSSPSASDIAALAVDAATTVSAVKDFTSATKSKCD